MFFSFTASIAFAAAHALGVGVEGVSAFAFELTVFFHEHLDTDAGEYNCHDDNCRYQDI